jgi:Na+-translocating ferredoxin:NAD+ oxidoreductase RnfC subunit
MIEKAGVVGCGGAGFPTYAKLRNGVEYFIINGAECEPLLCTDRFIMRNFAANVVSAICAVNGEIGAKHCCVALKESYGEEIKALTSAIEESGAPISLHLLRSFYPAGDEQIIVYEITGRVVPSGGIPPDVGCVVSNVATMLASYDAISGKPFISKYLTVNGEVKNPLIVNAPIGAPLTECLSLAGGAAIEDYCVLLGGPMMGKIVAKEALTGMTVTKTTSGIVVLPPDNRLANIQRMSVEHMSRRAQAACIRCSQCSDLCPRNLLGHLMEPHKIMRRLALRRNPEELPLDDEVVRSAALCCECGICELVACPMELQPRRINALLRKRLSAEGIRYPKGLGQKKTHPFIEMRKVPTGRAAARAGVYKYQKRKIDAFAEARPESVVLPMTQHVGSPCKPLLPDGADVSRGQLIAASPEGKLGSSVHASIDGKIEILHDAIRISSERRGG